jgi:hypothetical protein
MLVLFLYGFSVSIMAGDAETPYQLNAYIGIGYNRFISSLNEDGLNKNGFNGTLKILWKPEHLLRVGIETGYIRLFSVTVSNLDTEFGRTYLRTRMSAIPLFLIWSMELGKKFEINIGTGGFLLYSLVDSFDNKVTSTEFSNGYIISLTYLSNLYRDFDIGVELKWDYVNKIGNELRWGSLKRLSDGNILVQFVFKYHLLEW